ncbi:MAG: glutamate ligase domain-containing protein, partial [Actinomycetes bacterium]
VAAALAGARPRSRWRMEVSERSDGLRVLNDSYNANPESMSAALQTLAEFEPGRRGRRWAVLGDMLELGEVAAAEHAALGRRVAELEIDRLLAVGDHAEDVVFGARAAGMPSAHTQAYGSKDELAARLIAGVAGGDVVLVKASRGLALDTVAAQLLAAPARRYEREDPA